MTHIEGNRAASRFISGFIYLALAVSLVGLNARWLFAQGYALYSSEYLQSDARDNHGLVAADWVVRLTPYAAQGHVLRTGALLRAQQYEEAERALRTAIAHGANSPFIWQVFVRYKLHQTQVDEELARAIRRVQEMAPNSFELHSENARLGLMYWSWGQPEHRRLWSDSVRFVLRTRSKEFRRTVLHDRKEQLFCSEFGDLGAAGLKSWCRRALQARQACFGGKPWPGWRGWCRYHGFVEKPVK